MESGEVNVKRESCKMMIKLDRDFEIMLICAERYACGRRTYMPSLVCDYIQSLLPQLSENTINIMINDIHMTPDCWLGDECDIRTWRNFEKKLITASEERK